MTTNYVNTFILVSPDSRATAGTPPSKPGTVAYLQYQLLQESPYGLTSDEILFEVHALRNGIADRDREVARRIFFARPQACLRASPLVKTHGWGLHHDEHGRVALVGVETDAYRALAARSDLKVIPGMRSGRR